MLIVTLILLRTISWLVCKGQVLLIKYDRLNEYVSLMLIFYHEVNVNRSSNCCHKYQSKYIHDLCYDPNRWKISAVNWKAIWGILMEFPQYNNPIVIILILHCSHTSESLTRSSFYALSPLRRLANWISLGKIVTLLPCIAQRLVSSNSPTKYASADSWRASSAEAWKRISVLKFVAISLTRRWNGAFRIKSSVDFWYLRISRRATVPGLHRCFFFWPSAGAAVFS